MSQKMYTAGDLDAARQNSIRWMHSSFTRTIWAVVQQP